MSQKRAKELRRLAKEEKAKKMKAVSPEERYKQQVEARNKIKQLDQIRKHIYNVKVGDIWDSLTDLYDAIYASGVIPRADLVGLFWSSKDRLSFARAHKVIEMSPKILTQEEMYDAENWFQRDYDLSEKIAEYELKNPYTYLNRIYRLRQMTWRMLCFVRTMHLLEAKGIVTKQDLENAKKNLET